MSTFLAQLVSVVIATALLTLFLAWFATRLHQMQVLRGEYRTRRALVDLDALDALDEVTECFYCRRLTPAHALRDGCCRECGDCA